MQRSAQISSVRRMDRACPSNETRRLTRNPLAQFLVGYKTKRLHRSTLPLIDESAAGEGILIRQDHSRAIAQATGAWTGRLASRKACHDDEGRRLRRNESASLRACAFRTTAEGAPVGRPWLSPDRASETRHPVSSPTGGHLAVAPCRSAGRGFACPCPLRTPTALQ